MEQRSRSPRLPPELVHLVLQGLGRDTPTLAACAVACRDWVDLVRPYLFWQVVCTFDRVPGQLRHDEVDLARPSLFQRVIHRLSCAVGQFDDLSEPEEEDVRPQSSLPLLAEFITAHPAISSSVQHLDLRVGQSSWFHSYDLFVDVLRRLPRLRTVSLTGLPFHLEAPTRMADPRMDVSLPIIPALERLQLQSTPFWQIDHLLLIICLFGTIEQLVLGPYMGALHRGRADSLTNTFSQPRVDTLDLSEMSLRDFLVLPPLLQWQVRVLKVPELHHVGYSAMQGLLRVARRDVRSLHLTVGCIWPVLFDFTSFRADLSVLQLESVEVPLPLWHTKVVPPPYAVSPVDTRGLYVHRMAYASIVDTLGALPETVHTVVFRLFPRRGSPGRAPDDPLPHFAQIEEFCMRRDIRTVEIRPYPGDDIRDDDKRILREALPMLEQTGVLRLA